MIRKTKTLSTESDVAGEELEPDAPAELVPEPAVETQRQRDPEDAPAHRGRESFGVIGVMEDLQIQRDQEQNSRQKGAPEQGIADGGDHWGVARR